MYIESSLGNKLVAPIADFVGMSLLTTENYINDSPTVLLSIFELLIIQKIVLINLLKICISQIQFLTNLTNIHNH